MRTLTGSWQAIRTFGGATLLRNPWRTLRIRRAQDTAFSSLNTNTSRAIIFLTPGFDGVTGGLISFNSLIEESRKLFNIHGAITYSCPIPSDPPLDRYTKFDNSFVLVNFHRLIKALSGNCQDVLLHLPEYYVRSSSALRSIARIVDAGMRLRINIVLQNIDFCPTRDEVDRLREFGEVTVTTAHDAYGTPETARQLGCRLFHLSTWVCPEKFVRLPFSQKRNLLMLSPDPHPFRHKTIEILRERLPDFELRVVQKMSYHDYLDLCSMAKFSLTFGEGLDGYYIEPIFSGGISSTVYNNRFFTPRYVNTPLLYSNWRHLMDKLPQDIRKLDNEKAYNAVQEFQFNNASKDYVYERYLDNISFFYKYGTNWN
jgi:hypothetical protein